MDKKPYPTIQDLYPQLNEKDLAEAEDNLKRYLALMLRIFERSEMKSDQVNQEEANQLTDDLNVVSFIHQQGGR